MKLKKNKKMRINKQNEEAEIVIVNQNFLVAVNRRTELKFTLMRKSCEKYSSMSNDYQT